MTLPIIKIVPDQQERISLITQGIIGNVLIESNIVCCYVAENDEMFDAVQERLNCLDSMSLWKEHNRRQLKNGSVIRLGTKVGKYQIDTCGLQADTLIVSNPQLFTEEMLLSLVVSTMQIKDPIIIFILENKILPLDCPPYITKLLKHYSQ